MHRVCISGLGVEIPPSTVTNDELVASFNSWVATENGRRAGAGLPPLAGSDAGFIAAASGVEQRHFLIADGILDPDRMTPRIPVRGDESLSVMAEFGVASALKALADAGIGGGEVDLVICAASHHQRPYPAIAIEIQQAIGAAGGAFDMNLGCSSAAAALNVAYGLVRSGTHGRVLIVTPEIISGHLDFRDRQTHFIFGDASAAMVVEQVGADVAAAGRLEILGTELGTRFSNNIRTNFGFLSRTGQDDPSVLAMEGNMIKQNGNRVFREVTVAVHRFMEAFLERHGLTPEGIRRFWLHQANARMNAMILKLMLGAEADADRAPLVLGQLGNTAAAGAVIALKEHNEDLAAGDLGLFCAFGAGYSMGAALLRKL